MNVLVVGSGGREHTLAWTLAQSESVSRVFVAPGNAGTAIEPRINNIAIDVMAIDELIAFAQQESIALTVIGPEAPLAAGIVDQFSAAGLPCLGPSQAASQLEASKGFSKDFMQRHQIPTARYQRFSSPDTAIAYLDDIGMPCVIKADGLAAGKGVVIAQDHQHAVETITDFLSGDRFGAAGSAIVIEEFLHGEELSFMVLADDQDYLIFPSSQDHKARDEGDQGPNTGGMGAYSPPPLLTVDLQQQILTTVIAPTLTGMAAEGHPYRGFLYAGLMISPHGEINVLEYNCRLGDPETQAILPRCQSDFAQICLAATRGELAQQQCEWDPRPAVTVVMAAGGYPESYHKGDPIEGITEAEAMSDVKVFHAGTLQTDSGIITNGGRVLSITAQGDSIAAAQQQAYAAVDKITWNNVYFRRDIAHRALDK